MMGMGKHIYGLYGRPTVFPVKHLQVPGLCGRIAAYVDYP